MKLQQSKRGLTIKAGNAKELTLSSTAELSKTEYYWLVALVADMFDMIATGEQIYMTIGSTKDRSAYTLTVRTEGEPVTLYGVSLRELVSKCQSLL